MLTEWRHFLRTLCRETRDNYFSKLASTFSGGVNILQNMEFAFVLESLEAQISVRNDWFIDTVSQLNSSIPESASVEAEN